MIPIEPVDSVVAPVRATTVPTVVPRVIPIAVTTTANALPMPDIIPVPTVTAHAIEVNTPANPNKSIPIT
ncbi:hypothetical protein D3C71_1947190 [compost metagenome]